MSLVKCRERGFSLVELMVALVVGLLVLLGAFELLVSGKRNFDRASAIFERQESLRFIVDSISYDVRSASSFDLLDVSEDVLSNFERLSVNLDKESTVCPESSSYTVVYSQQDEEIYTVVDCGDGESSPLPIVLGVGDVNFRYLQPGVGVVVEIVMSDRLQRIADQTYRFRFANRSAVGRMLELWGNENGGDDDSDDSDDSDEEVGG